MGVCTSNQKYIKNPRVEQIVFDAPQMPVAKYKLEFPCVTEYINEIPIIEISGSLAYNYIIKQGVNKQKNTLDAQTESVGVCLYEEKYKKDYSDEGFIMVDLKRLDRLIQDKKNYRVLFNFKIIWIFRDSQAKLSGFVNILQEINVKIKQIHLYPKSLFELMNKFKMTSEINILNSYYPLLIFDSQDILDQTKRKEESHRIYIHNSTSLNTLMDQKFTSLYNSNLQVRNIIFFYQDIEVQLQKQLQDNLYIIQQFQINTEIKVNIDVIIKEFIPYVQQQQEMGSNVVLIYSSQQPNSLQFAKIAIEQYLCRKYLLNQENVNKYIELLRSLNIAQPQQLKSQLIETPLKQVVNNIELNEISRLDEVKENYQKLFKKIKAYAMVQSCHITLLKLINNIIDNPSEEKFRIIKASNKSIHLNIAQYQEGKNILKIIGFNEQELEFKNLLEISMLKIIRADLELAWRKFSDDLQIQK